MENLKTVDLTYLKEMTDNEPAAMKEMIDIFKRQIPEFIQEMKNLHEKEKWTDLGNLAHKAKSSVAVMGINPVAQKLKELEIDAKKGENIGQYSKIIAYFEDECNKAVSELNVVYDNL